MIKARKQKIISNIHIESKLISAATTTTMSVTTSVVTQTAAATAAAAAVSPSQGEISVPTAAAAIASKSGAEDTQTPSATETTATKHIKETQERRNKGKGKIKEKKQKKDKKEESGLILDDEKEELDIDLQGIPNWILKLMDSQPTLNIMTIGDVSHGKSTLMWGLCNEKTGRDSREVKRNMTIKLGYTSCKIFKCANCYYSNEICYFSASSTISMKKVKCPKCSTSPPFVKLVRHISFVDCPGHAEYMGTMISAACVVCLCFCVFACL